MDLCVISLGQIEVIIEQPGLRNMFATHTVNAQQEIVHAGRPNRFPALTSADLMWVALRLTTYAAQSHDLARPHGRVAENVAYNQHGVMQTPFRRVIKESRSNPRLLSQ